MNRAEGPTNFDKERPWKNRPFSRLVFSVKTVLPDHLSAMGRKKRPHFWKREVRLFTIAECPNQHAFDQPEYLLEKFEMLSTIARYSLRSLILFSCLAVAEITFCQEDDVLSRIYGTGVHAYFRGDYRQAHARLTTAIESGNRDPRAYYFRGLAYQKLGRPEQANQDFAAAAAREVRDGNLADPVSRALMRVQGPTRLKLESYRTEARRQINKRHSEMDEDRFTPRGKERQSPPPVVEPEEVTTEETDTDFSPSEEPTAENETDDSEKPKDEPGDPFTDNETDDSEKPEEDPEDPFTDNETDDSEKPKDEPEDPFTENETDDSEKPEEDPENPFDS